MRKVDGRPVPGGHIDRLERVAEQDPGGNQCHDPDFLGFSRKELVLGVVMNNTLTNLVLCLLSERFWGRLKSHATIPLLYRKLLPLDGGWGTSEPSAPRVVFDAVAPQVLRFLSVLCGANALAGKAFALRETPLLDSPHVPSKMPRPLGVDSPTASVIPGAPHHPSTTQSMATIPARKEISCYHKTILRYVSCLRSP